MKERDRDSWCTPKWLTQMIGQVDLDPCSNERSHVLAHKKISLPDDGLQADIYGNPITFINPPYSNVLPWVLKFRDTRFIFLLRFDPSTRWFKEIMKETRYLWFPEKRLEFEPPPGVQPSTNPYPHALYFRLPPPSIFHTVGTLGAFK